MEPRAGGVTGRERPATAVELKSVRIQREQRPAAKKFIIFG